MRWIWRFRRLWLEHRGMARPGIRRMKGSRMWWVVFRSYVVWHKNLRRKGTCWILFGKSSGWIPLHYFPVRLNSIPSRVSLSNRIIFFFSWCLTFAHHVKKAHEVRTGLDREWINIKTSRTHLVLGNEDVPNLAFALIDMSAYSNVVL